MSDRRELEHLIRGIDEEIRDARREVKEAETTGDVELKRITEQDIAALQDQRAQAVDSLNRLGDST